MTEKLSTTLLYLSRTVRLRVHVSFIERDRNMGGMKKKKKFHEIYDFNGTSYYSLDFGAYMTLELRDGEEWDPNKNIMIHQKNIFQIIHGIGRLIDNIYLPDTFYMEKTISGEVLKVPQNVARERQVSLFNIGMKQNLIMIPQVIYDEMEDAEYEGAVFLLNDKSNVMELSISELETLLYTLKKVDLFTYGYTMIDFYYNNIQTHIGENRVGMGDEYVKASRKNLFEERKRHGSETVSTLKKEISDEDFFGL